MKILNTVQDLWSYCRFCPICQDLVRDVFITVGPDEVFNLFSFKKDNHILKLRCFHHLKNKKFKANYNINCLDNTFQCNISDPEISDKSIDKTSSPYFYFYIQSDCKQCCNSFANSLDLELDLANSKITNIGIEREGIYLLKEKNKFHITLQHDSKTMIVSRCFVDENGTVVDDNKLIEFPIVDLDFSKPRKVINRIKTLLLFS